MAMIIALPEIATWWDSGDGNQILCLATRYGHIEDPTAAAKLIALDAEFAHWLLLNSPYAGESGILSAQADGDDLNITLVDHGKRSATYRLHRAVMKPNKFEFDLLIGVRDDVLQ